MIEHTKRLNQFYGGVASVQILSEEEKVSIFHQNTALSLSDNGKLYELNPTCSYCGSKDIVHNGNDTLKSQFWKELGLKIKRGKFRCKKCKCCWTTKFNAAEDLLEEFQKGIEGIISSLIIVGLSLESIESFLLQNYSKDLCRERIREIYEKYANSVKPTTVTESSGIFHFDLQCLTVNGKRMYRCEIIDAVTKKVIFDELLEESKCETLADTLNMLLRGYTKKVFIIDLAKGYPEMLQSLFEKVEVQWCLFHLNQLIIRDFEKEKVMFESGKKYLRLEQLYNLYSMLNLFLNHDVEVQYLKRQLLTLEETFKNFESRFSGLKIERTSISVHEINLLNGFYEFRKGLKNFRRKYTDKYLLRRTIEETEEVLKKLEGESFVLPNKAKKRLKMIRENMDKLTLFQRNPQVPPTNNTIEQYHSATLQKTEKKISRSLDSMKKKLLILREKWNGTLQRNNFDFIGFLKRATKIIQLFDPT